MILYTIQEERVLKKVFSDEGYSIKSFKDTMWYDKEYRHPEFIDHFENAYNWMICKMQSKIKDSPKNIMPIWAWKCFEGKKPDLRRIGFANRGNRMLRITLNIPNDEVLLSDFDLWHYVLNASYIPEYEEDSYDNISYAGMVKSWDRILDETCFGDSVQATFWTLKPEYITKIEYFVAK